MRTRPPIKICGLKPITVLWRGRSGGGICSCSWSRWWVCSGMHTSLRRKYEDATYERKYFVVGESYAAMVGRSGNASGMAGCVIWDAGRRSVALGITLVCRALMKMMAATRMINTVTTKAMTTGRIGTSPTRRSGVGSLGEGFWSFMD
jgi:hypothetical protein